MDQNTGYEYYRRKADQEYELAGLARQDGDSEDATRHLAKAREYDQLASSSK